MAPVLGMDTIDPSSRWLPCSGWTPSIPRVDGSRPRDGHHRPLESMAPVLWMDTIDPSGRWLPSSGWTPSTPRVDCSHPPGWARSAPSASRAPLHPRSRRIRSRARTSHRAPAASRPRRTNLALPLRRSCSFESSKRWTVLTPTSRPARARAIFSFRGADKGPSAVGSRTCLDEACRGHSPASRVARDCAQRAHAALSRARDGMLAMLLSKQLRRRLEARETASETGPSPARGPSDRFENGSCPSSRPARPSGKRVLPQLDARETVRETGLAPARDLRDRPGNAPRPTSWPEAVGANGPPSHLVAQRRRCEWLPNPTLGPRPQGANRPGSF